MTNTNILWGVVALAAIAIAAMVLLAAVSSRRRTRAKLRRRFGPEYDRVAEELGSPSRADRELAARSRRVDRIRLHELSDGDRARFASTWSRIQLQFVDDPQGATAGAHELIKEVMRARGYPQDDFQPGDNFERRVADLSVDHPAVVQHYRAARELSEANRSAGAKTEELRQALVHYHALFSDLLQDNASGPRVLHDLHA